MTKPINKQLYGAACSYLAMREHGAVELFKKLKKKYPEVMESEINNLIDFLKDKNFQSDKRYLEMLIKSRYNKGYGMNMIRAYVMNKDVNMNMFDQIFYSLDLDLESSCYSFLEKYSHKDRDKLIRKAVNRGFSYEQVKNNLKKLDNEAKDML